MKNKITILLSVFFILSCKIDKLNASRGHIPSDKNATNETIALYDNLFKLRNKGVMFGHQDDLAYGVNWRYEDKRSDVKDVTGDYPAVYGWDLGGLEVHSETNLDGVPFVKMKQYITDIYDKGGISTVSWHMDNPLTGKNAWDTTPNSLSSILPGGSKHELYKSWLDNGADFLLSLKGSDGKMIPILYRPFHELTGNWFWWGKNNGTPEQFKQIWRFTIDYFKSRGVHNLIYVYNTSTVDTKEAFLEYYPGTEYADVLSFDNYLTSDPLKNNSFVERSLNLFGIIDKIATDQNKLIAFAEMGYEGVPYYKFWTDTLLDSMGDYKISYALAWRNYGWQEKEQKMHFYAPYKGQLSEKDFVNFYKLEKTLFQKDITKENLYK